MYFFLMMILFADTFVLCFSYEKYIIRFVLVSQIKYVNLMTYKYVDSYNYTF